MVIKILRKSSSSVDKGSYFANANRVNNSNAKKDALNFYTAVKEFFNMHLDVYIVAATMTFWDMKSINDKVVPDEVRHGDSSVQREWLHQEVIKMVEHFAMQKLPTIDQDIVSCVHYQCRGDNCTKVFPLKAVRKQHEASKHGLGCLDQPSSEASSSGNKEDHKFNYGCVTISLGLLLRNADDAVREGDGERIIRVWKFLMPLFKLHNHQKYALAALRMQAEMYSLLTGSLAHELKWNRTVSNHGGRGRHLSRDLRLEHINKVAKESLKSQGAMNINEKLARRAGNCIGKIEMVLESVEKELVLSKPSSHHKSKYACEDFKVLLHEVFDEADLFRFQAGREYSAFPKFSRDTLQNLDMKSVRKWIQHHTKLWQKDQEFSDSLRRQ